MSVLRERLRPAVHFWLRVLVYDALLSLMAAASFVAASLLAVEPGDSLHPQSTIGIDRAAVLALVLLCSAGYGGGLLAVRLFHRRELPFYQNHALSFVALSFISFVLTAIVTALAAVIVWVAA
jgi:membrane protein YqaA with SNARE-associated domain